MKTTFWNHFYNPPTEYTQCPFWFLNGTVDGEEYAAQMDRMAEQGVRQAMPHPRFGMDRREYLTEHYFAEFGKLLERAEKNGYLVNLYDEYNWSSGSAGGRLTENPDCCAMGISVACARVTQKFMYDAFEQGFRGWGRFAGILQVGYAPYQSDREIDLEHCIYLEEYRLDENRLELELPEGDWLVFVIFLVRTQHPSPLRQGNGGIVDYLNPEVTRLFLDATHEQYFRHFSHYFGKTIPSIFYDEVSPYASGNFTWTSRFAEEFQIRKGYSLLNQLPLLFFDGGSETPKVRCDYWDVLTALFTEGFLVQTADWCDQHGIALTGHSHEDSALWSIAGDLFRNLRCQQWVGLDSLGGYKPYHVLKPAISVAHVAGSKIIVCEAAGVYEGWNCSPRMLKKAFHQLAVAGVNMVVPHGFFQTVDNPKAECPPSYFDNNPYWLYYREFSRMTDMQCFVNRETKPVIELALLYPIVSWQACGRLGRGRDFPWGIRKEALSESEPEFQVFDEIIDVLMGHQMDLDVVDSQALQESRLEDKQFAVGENHYRILVLPPMSTIRLEDARKLVQLAEHGISIVSVGVFAPLASAERGTEDEELKYFMKLLQKKIHSVKVTERLPEQISDIIEPDIVILHGNSSTLDASHRRTDGIDFYLLFHTADFKETIQVSVRCVRAETVILDHFGRRVPAEIRIENERTTIALSCVEESLYYLVLSDEAVPAPQWIVKGEKQSSDGLQTLWRQPSVPQKNAIFLPLPEKLYFTVYPQNPKHAGAAIPQQRLLVPVFHSLEIPYESGNGEELTRVWNKWHQFDFDDTPWEEGTLKRESKLYNHTGSRLFRFVIPAGAIALHMPLPVSGEYALYLNGKRIEASISFTSQEEHWLSFSGCEDKPGVLGIECSSMMPNFGILSPPEFLMEPFATALSDWRTLGLGWYSGFGVYEWDISVTDLSHPQWMDLGNIRECTEILVNGQSAARLIWPPYRFELTPFLKEGENHIRMFVCNLISNEYAWDTLGTRGGGECLPSGWIPATQSDNGIDVPRRDMG